MTAGHRIRAGLICVAAMAALAACGGGTDDIAIEARSAQELFTRAEAELASNNPDEAAVLFTEIERLYP